MKKLNKKGFTIVELVIVIAVIAILAAVLIPTFSGVVSKANASAALQTAKSTLTNALTMSSTAQLQEGTKIVVDGYAFNYTGNQMVQTDYVTADGNAYDLTTNGVSASVRKFNAVIISADSLYNSASTAIAVSNADYKAKNEVMTVKNDAANVLKKYAKDTLGCLDADITNVTCVMSGTTAHYYVNYVASSAAVEDQTGDSVTGKYVECESTDSGAQQAKLNEVTKYFKVTTDTEAQTGTTYYTLSGDTDKTAAAVVISKYHQDAKEAVTTATYDAEIYVNSDLDKDVVVFTVFGK